MSTPAPCLVQLPQTSQTYFLGVYNYPISVSVTRTGWIGPVGTQVAHLPGICHNLRPKKASNLCHDGAAGLSVVTLGIICLEFEATEIAAGWLLCEACS